MLPSDFDASEALLARDSNDNPPLSTAATPTAVPATAPIETPAPATTAPAATTATPLSAALNPSGVEGVIPSSSAAASASASASTSASAAASTSASAAASASTSPSPSPSPSPSSSASASASASATNSAVPSISNKGFSKGALAGGVVGAFIGGFVIAFLVAFLFFRRSKRGNRAAAGYLSSASAEKGTSKDHTPIVSYATKNDTVASEGFGVAAFVPEPADDGTVSTKIESLFDQISLHIDNYYVRLASNPMMHEEITDAMRRYKSHFPLESILATSGTQKAGLTYVLAYRILGAIQPGSDASSLLPACYRWGPHQDRYGHFEHVQDSAAFNWRMLTAYLNTKYPSVASEQTDEYISSLASDFTTTFAKYKNPDFPDSEREAHLTSVIKAASGLGVWLFAQPCLFQFDWRSDLIERGQSQLPIFPSVVKVCDEHGRPLKTHQMIVAGKTRTV